MMAPQSVCQLSPPAEVRREEAMAAVALPAPRVDGPSLERNPGRLLEVSWRGA